MPALIFAGILLIGLGLLSRFFGLALLKRISSSPTREVTASWLPGTPWIRLESDRNALKVIVWATYTDILAGMTLILIAVLA